MPGPRRAQSLTFLAIGTILFAGSFAVIAKLIELGSMNLVDGRNPISFCNVLFAGNIVAGLTFALLFRKDLNGPKLADVDRTNWLWMLGIGLLEGGLAPAMIFLALEESTATNVVLIQSIQIPLVLFAGWLLYRERCQPPAVIGAIIATIGVILIVLLGARMSGGHTTEPPSMGSEWKALVASVLFVFATQARRRPTLHFPLGLYSIIRSVMGSLFFAIVVILYFGPEHFADVFSPYLWKWMLVYGGIIVALGQTAWHIGLRYATSTDLTIAEGATPLIGMAAALFLLQDPPTTSQLIGGAVIIAGLALILKTGVAARSKASGNHRFSGV